MSNRVTQIPAEAVLRPSSQRMHATQSPVEAVLSPTTQRAHVTQQILEIVVSNSNASSTGGLTSSSIWTVLLEENLPPKVNQAHSGTRNILFRLSTNVVVPSIPVFTWNERNVASELMPVSAGNFLSWGFFLNVNWNTVFPTFPSGQLWLGVIGGPVWYDNALNVVLDDSGYTVYGNPQLNYPNNGTWAKIKPISGRPSAVPTNAAYVRMVFGVGVANNTGTDFSTGNNLYADVRFDDFWMVQQTDPTIEVQSKGSLPPSATPSFAYTSTKSSITWIWTSLGIFRSDGTFQPITDGSITINGLAAGTTYNGYPYWDEDLEAMAWVAGGSGTAPNNILFTNALAGLTQGQQQNLNQRVALSPGPLVAATVAASGSGSGGGFGGGSGRTCLRKGMLVLTREHGVKKIEECKVGEWIFGRHGWTQIVDLTISKHHGFIRHDLSHGNGIETTPTHPFTLCGDEGDIGKRAMDISMNDVFYIRNGLAFPRKSEYLDVDCEKVRVGCFPHHEFYAGSHAPDISTHNWQLLS